MPSLEQVALGEEEQAVEGEEEEVDAFTDQEEQDLHIAWMISEEILEQGALTVILDSLEQSESPEQVIGQAIAQILMQIDEQFTGEDKLSPRIYFSENGLVEIIGDFLEDEGVPEDVVGKAEMVAYATLRQVGQGRAAQEQQAAQPVAPQPGVM